MGLSIVRDLHSPEHRMGGLGFSKSAVGHPPVGSPIPMNKNCRLSDFAVEDPKSHC
jgi:hypothetical protein